MVRPFYNEDDIKWLKLFDKFNLNINQKEALIFAREVGAVDTLTYSQMNLVPASTAFEELLSMEKTGLLIKKGRTDDVAYYKFNEISQVNLPSRDETSQVDVSDELKERISKLGKKVSQDQIKAIIIELCEIHPRTRKELAGILHKSEEYLRKEILPGMLGKELSLLYPERPNAPNQAYKAK